MSTVKSTPPWKVALERTRLECVSAGFEEAGACDSSCSVCPCGAPSSTIWVSPNPLNAACQPPRVVPSTHDSPGANTEKSSVSAALLPCPTRNWLTTARLTGRQEPTGYTRIAYRKPVTGKSSVNVPADTDLVPSKFTSDHNGFVPLLS